ncbi:hypothetical protein GUJ93_ZPchr0010g8635 [Zizania palustris]|uniref:Uncharacterized protein n=1 Tax=Zizania palustris TaxID=103762 RepID=A0A8J5WGE2_ZIZPA|nr:hypothetical protein GUJ93_ZPchr0010g8635 [Zizania palustris]
MSKKDATGPISGSHLVQQNKAVAIVAAASRTSSSAWMYGTRDLRPPSEKFLEQTLVLERSTCTEETMKNAVHERL